MASNNTVDGQESGGLAKGEGAQATEAFLIERLGQLRTRLLDLTGRNKLLNFRHATRSGKMLRIIDERIELIAEKLDEGALLALEGIPAPAGPTREQEEKLEAALKAAMRSDSGYLAEVEALRQLHEGGVPELEMEPPLAALRARVAAKCKLPNVKRVSIDELARQLGICPEVDLGERLTAGLPGDGGQTEPAAAKHTDRTLRVLARDDELDAQGTGLYRESVASMQERGFNNLHLCMGFLEWYSADEPDKAMLAPLLLHEVTIERTLRGSRYRFAIRSVLEGSTTNLTLAERLRRDFGLALPALGEEMTATEYFAQVRDAIGTEPARAKWCVRQYATLAPMSFTRIAMFRDLDPELWSASAESGASGQSGVRGNGLLSSAPLRMVLAGESGGLTGLQGGEAEVFTPGTLLGALPDYATDTHPLSSRLCLVADADSSQISAMIDVAAGRNLVIEGPPGTGKSQTITNIISTAIAEGKTVLFVAEKMAALEVVRSRLGAVGLGPLCLELHSGNRAQVMETLRQRAELVTPQVQHEAVARTTAQQQEHVRGLTELVGALAAPVSGTGATVWGMVWTLQALRDRCAAVCAAASSSANASRWALACDELERASLGSTGVRDANWQARWQEHAAGFAAMQSQLARAYGSGCDGSNPWAKLMEGEARIASVADARTLMRELEHADKLLRELAQAASKAEQQFGLRTSTLAIALTGQERAELLRQALALDAMVLASLHDEALRESIDGWLSADLAVRESAAEVASARLEGEPEADDAGLAQLSAIGACAAKLSTLGTDSAQGVGPVSELAAAAARAAESAGNVARTAAGMLEAMRMFGLTRGDGRTLTLAAALATAAGKLDDRSIAARQSSVCAPDALRVLEMAAAEHARLLQERAELGKVLRLPVDGAAELRGAADSLRDAGMIARLLGSGYRKAKALYASMATSPTNAVTDAERSSRLMRAAELLRAEQQWAGDGRLMQTLGTLAAGMNSDVMAAMGAARFAAQVRAAIDPMDSRASVLEANLLDRQTGDDAWLRRLGAAGRMIELAHISRWGSGAEARSGEEVLDAAERGAALEAARVAELAELAGAAQLRSDVPVTQLAALGAAADRLRAARAMRAKWQEKVGEVGRRGGGGAGDTPEGGPSAVGELMERYRPAAAWCRRVDGVCGPSATNKILEAGGGKVGEAASAAAAEASLMFTRGAATQRQLDAVGKVTLLQLGIDSAATELSPLIEALGGLLRGCQGEGLVATVQRQEHRRGLEALGLGEIVALAEQAAGSELGADEGEFAQSMMALMGRGIAAGELRAAVASQPLLAGFAGQSMDAMRARFAQIDRQWIELQRTRPIATALQKPLPEGSSGPRVADKTQLALVRHEMGKKRNYLPMRQLMERAGEAMLGLCPCVMMSPLSVAEYLGPRGAMFDLLVVDEASQMRIEQALGAIARARQMVIVGDSKQLPPTTFFDGSQGEQTSEDEESILDLAARQLPSFRRLRWHYRSRHQSLIAFCNEQFYQGELIVFPSPVDDAAQLGVQGVAVDGVYAAGLNPIEANRLIAAAVQHAKETPELSLGMVAVNREQAELLSDLWDEVASQDAMVATFISRHAASLDAVFVKNLENVQGDERDVMMISTVYGKDAQGAFHQRFGPINNAGGQRRLNVLFTRAKRRMVIFTSMDARQITGSSAGAQALAGMLKYATLAGQPVSTERRKEGRAESAAARPAEGVFQRTLVQRLTAAGLIAQPDVGVAGLRIEVGVALPADPSRFVLGVVGDGPMYQNARNTRDRDRLRDEVLTRLGWNLHRVWSLDWLANGEGEVRKIIEAVERSASSK